MNRICEEQQREDFTTIPESTNKWKICTKEQVDEKLNDDSITITSHMLVTYTHTYTHHI
jgi:hypothetical protein